MLEQDLITLPHDECSKKNIKQKWYLLMLVECGELILNC